jgi:hypothetical protein
LSGKQFTTFWEEIKKQHQRGIAEWPPVLQRKYRDTAEAGSKREKWDKTRENGIESY